MLQIHSVAINVPFIEIQHQTFKYFMTGDYSFVVFNNGQDTPDFTNNYKTGVRTEIRQLCERLNIQCVDVVNDHHSRLCPSARHIDALQIMLNMQTATSERYLTLDGDMFPITPISTDMYSEWDCAVIPQRDTYFWPGYCYFDMAKVSPKHLLSWDFAPDCDSGGAMQHYLRATENKLKKVQYLCSLQWTADDYPATLDSRWLELVKSDGRNVDGKLWSELYDKQFLHFRDGSNWNRRPIEETEARLQTLHKTVFEICRDA